MLLFFETPIVDRDALRDHARKQVETSSLIRRCADGDRAHAHALKTGFWYFVREFEQIIDKRAVTLPWSELHNRFGRAKVRRTLVPMANHLRAMQEEEGQHAALWREDALRLGLSDSHLDGVNIRAVSNLVEIAWRAEPWHLFCCLAGTEYIAEELARDLCDSEFFLGLFDDAPRWCWGEAHLALHDGPSHGEIDEDLARAFLPDNKISVATEMLEQAIRRYEELFFEAAEEILIRLQ